jgi:DNA-directed RNA polymerase subunit H
VAIKRRKRRKREALQISHFLVPKHELVKEDEVDKILEKFGVTKDKLPKIKEWDPAIANLGAKEGDVIRIYRKEDGVETVYYRVVTSV